MSVDQHGNDLTDADPAAVAAYDAAVDHLLHFRSEVGDLLSAALAVEPGLAMGRAMEAYLGVLGTEPDDVAAARESLTSYVAATDTPGLLPRERQHLAAAGVGAVAIVHPGRPTAERNDGNDVNLDRESMLLARTQSTYQVAALFAQGEIRKLRQAISESMTH